jgi:hypothetical protein
MSRAIVHDPPVCAGSGSLARRTCKRALSRCEAYVVGRNDGLWWARARPTQTGRAHVHVHVTEDPPLPPAAALLIPTAQQDPQPIGHYYCAMLRPRTEGRPAHEKYLRRLYGCTVLGHRYYGNFIIQTITHTHTGQFRLQMSQAAPAGLQCKGPYSALRSESCCCEQACWLLQRSSSWRRGWHKPAATVR